MKIIRGASLVVSQWRNSAGRKADIASGPDWLVGFAFLDADAPFSDYVETDRTITLLEGPGFALDFTGPHAAASFRLLQIHMPVKFDGGWPTQCRILGGPCVVLNVMTARASHGHSLEIMPATAVPRIEGGAGEDCIVVVLAGTLAVTINGTTHMLAARDSIQLNGAARLDAGPDTVLAIVRISSVEGTP